MLAKLKCLVVGCGWVAWMAIASQTAGAQDPDASTDLAVDPVRVSVGNGGLQRNVPGRWAILSVGGSNATDRDVEETVVVTVGDQKNLQYARQIWIPAGSRRGGSLPIQIPSGVPMDQHQVEIRSTRLRRDADQAEQFVPNAVGDPETSTLLLLSEEEARAAVLFDVPTDLAAEEEMEAVANTIDVIRDRELVSTRQLGLIRFNEHFLPANPVGLDSLDQLILAGDRVLDDSMSPSLIVRWVQSGGRLWVMLDRMDPVVVRGVLGELANYSIVDRVELNAFTLSGADKNSSSGAVTSSDWNDEMPVDMVRVVQDSGEVLADVDGWPAVFKRRVGDGEILFSTLGARGWLLDQEPLMVLESVGRQFFGRRTIQPVPSEPMASLADSDIGYRIPSRGMITGILGSHLALVIAAGIWLFRRKQLQWLAAVVPVASGFAALLLIGLGKQQVNAIEATVATTQIVKTLPSSNHVQISSMTAVFASEERELELTTSGDASSMLMESIGEAELKRIVWGDGGNSHWKFVRQPPGVVRHITVNRAVELAEPWSARGTFNEGGFSATIHGLDGQQIEDAIAVATPAPHLALLRGPVTPPSEGATASLRGGVDEVLPPNQYVVAGIVTEAQRGRQDFLRQIMATDSSMFGSGPTVLAWTKPIESGLSFGGDFVPQGSALVSIPVVWNRPQPGSPFQVPATFVKIRPHKSERGTTTVMNERDGKWLELNEARDAEIRCEIPAVLLPCMISKATVEIKISAPSRTLEVKSRKNGDFVSLFQAKNPSGVVRFAVDDPGQLELDESGGWVLLISVSGSDDEESLQPVDGTAPGTRYDDSPNRSFWQIESMQVTYNGTTL